MARQKNIIKINLPGGIVSTGDLLSIVKVSEQLQVKEIRLGTRQQMYIPIGDAKLTEITKCLEESAINFEVNFDDFPNIVSSYVTDELFNKPNWLTEGVYADVLDAFNYIPRLKVNIIDSTQTLVPFFTGNVNFIASSTSNYWYLYVRFPKMTESHQWKGLIYTQDVPQIAKHIEEVIYENEKIFLSKTLATVELLQEKLIEKQHFLYQPITDELQLPKFNLPYYEGINEYRQKFWLGVYRRDEHFSLDFIKDICAVCLKTKIGKIYITPWKSILIKGIDPEDRKYWSYILGKHHINVRHAFNELNWQVEDLNTDGLNIKRYLVRRFDSADLKTQGLCFAIKTQPNSGLFGSVVIKRLPNTSRGKQKITDRFDILYTPDFNPNSKNYVVYKRKLALNVLDEHLKELSNIYYDQIGINNLISNELIVDEPRQETDVLNDKIVYQCTYCLTIYDEEYGDEENEVPVGTAFKNLPENYCCSTCNAEKESFKAVRYQSLMA